MKLNNSKNNFERGQTDVFNLTLPNLGEVKRIVIGHDNNGVGSAWHLNAVSGWQIDNFSFCVLLSVCPRSKEMWYGKGAVYQKHAWRRPRSFLARISSCKTPNWSERILTMFNVAQSHPSLCRWRSCP